MRQWLTFNGKSSKDFGVYISGLNTYNAPERDVEVLSIPGKNGDLTIDNGRYKNITVSYPAFIYDQFDQNIEGLRNYLLSQSGYKRLEDTYHPEEFRLGRFRGEFSAKVVDWLEAGEFDLEFDCYPQRFLKSGEQPLTFTAAGSIHNEYMPSKPLIRAYGTGSFTISGVSVQITTANEYTDIDCELMEAYKGSTNCNGNIVLTNGTFPVLNQGDNSVGISGLTRIEITPRWWIL